VELREEKRHGHLESKNKTDTNSLIDDAHRGWNDTKVQVCVYTHTAYVHYSNRPPLVSISLCSVVDMFRVADISLQRLDTWIAVGSQKCSFISCVPLHWLLTFVVFP
jgi:hypothetical protein